MKTRKIYLDCLRWLAIFAVIVMHAAARCARVLDVGNIQWQIAEGAISASRWGVPVFVMISGVLFLNREQSISIQTLYKKYIARIGIAYLFWSCLYTVICSTLKYYNPFSLVGVWNTIAGTIKGGYPHLWFIWMLLGLYIILPVLRPCVDALSVKELQYLLAINFVVGICIPTFRQVSVVNSLMGENLDNFHVGFLGGYIFYFLLGSYLDRFPLSSYARKILYTLGIIALVYSVLAVAVSSGMEGVLVERARDNLTPNIAMMSAALFVFVQQNVQNQAWLPNLAAKMSKHIFGVYLIHEIFLDFLGLKIMELLIQVIPVIFVLPCLVLVTLLPSIIVVMFLSKNRMISKYIL